MERKSVIAQIAVGKSPHGIYIDNRVARP
jgi:hypothetical protein